MFCCLYVPSKSSYAPREVLLWVDEAAEDLCLGGVLSGVCPATGQTASSAASRPAAIRAGKVALFGDFAALIVLL